MELPFAVESPERSLRGGSALNRSNASSLVTASSQESAVLSEGVGEVSSPGPTSFEPTYEAQMEEIDFTYVTVCEEDADEVDIVIDGGEVLTVDSNGQEYARKQKPGDVLAILLGGETQHKDQKTEAFVVQCERATDSAQGAHDAKNRGDLQMALESHTQAAKLFRSAASDVREIDASLANSLLLLSQSQARSAMALKRVLKRGPTNKRGPKGRRESHKDRLLATVRGALVTQKEADISESTFLGRATKGPVSEKKSGADESKDKDSPTTGAITANKTNSNPVDEMMELEKELRDMDMALELGNSIASLGSRARMKPAMDEGSFCVVPPGSASFMSSSTMWSAGNTNARTAGVRARANRVQPVTPRAPPPTVTAPPTTLAKPGLESSWWGHASGMTTASQVLASSIMGASPQNSPNQTTTTTTTTQAADTKQLMRLLDSLKTLGDENAALLREVEEAESARMEARAAREQMKRFKVLYGERFDALKKALEKFRKGYPENNGNGGDSNPVTTSGYVLTSEMQQKDDLIKQLTNDLKREKDEGRKKDAALRKYESFYREVKARSAQKARQREAAQNHQRQRKNVVPPRVPR